MERLVALFAVSYAILHDAPGVGSRVSLMGWRQDL